MLNKTDPRQIILEAMREQLPKFFTYNEQDILNAKTIHNLVSQGKGPPIVQLNKRNFLERDSFIQWIDTRDSGVRRGRKRKAI